MKPIIKLTNKQKQEIVDLYYDDFYSMNIIDYLSEICPLLVKKALKSVLKQDGTSWKEWLETTRLVNEEWDCEACEYWEEVELDTMNILLEWLDIDTDKTYYEEESELVWNC